MSMSRINSIITASIMIQAIRVRIIEKYHKFELHCRLVPSNETHLNISSMRESVGSMNIVSNKIIPMQYILLIRVIVFRKALVFLEANPFLNVSI